MRRTEEPISSFKSKFLILCLLTYGLTACATNRPAAEYVLAREALVSAREVDSARYAPGFYYKAEEAFRHGVNSYQNRSYGAALEFFKETMVYAEKAENSARVHRQKSGEEAL